MKSHGTLVLALLWFIAIPANRVKPSPWVDATASPIQDDFGTIKGRIVWGGDPERIGKILVKKGQAARDAGVCATDQDMLDPSLVVDPKTKGVRYVFAYLRLPKGKHLKETRKAAVEASIVAIDVKNCEFFPHAIAINDLQKLEITSQDPIAHNVNYQSKTYPFNEILRPEARLEKLLEAEPRPIQARCDIHPTTYCYIMVFDHPFYAVTGARGTFEIGGVPAGKQSLVLWHELKGFLPPGRAVGREVEIKPGEVIDVGDIVLE